jgi:cytoskeleton protein RodZ
MTDIKHHPEPEGPTDGASKAYPDLKAIREAKGLTLQDIFARTRITVVNLDAIEQGQFHRLPAPVYARTFIKHYAQVIGMESRTLLDAYDRYLKSIDDRILQDQQESGERQNKEKRFKQLVGLSCILLILIVAFLFFSNHKQKEREAAPAPPSAAIPQPAETKPTEQPPAVSAPPASDAVQPARTEDTAAAKRDRESPPAETAPRPAEETRPVRAKTPEPQKPETDIRYRLAIQANETVWIRIREDRNPSRQMILEAGDALECSASEEIILDIGNAGGIDITFQGKPVGSIGKRGQVVHLRFP